MRLSLPPLQTNTDAFTQGDVLTLSFPPGFYSTTVVAGSGEEWCTSRCYRSSPAAIQGVSVVRYGSTKSEALNPISRWHGVWIQSGVPANDTCPDCLLYVPRRRRLSSPRLALPRLADAPLLSAPYDRECVW